MKGSDGRQTHSLEDRHQIHQDFFLSSDDEILVYGETCLFKMTVFQTLR